MIRTCLQRAAVRQSGLAWASSLSARCTSTSTRTFMGGTAVRADRGASSKTQQHTNDEGGSAQDTDTSRSQTKRDSDDEVSFGFLRVPRELKEGFVGEVFARVAPKYDKMNDAMSMGVHRLWKRDFVADLNAGDGTRVLDVAGGTGDIAFRILHRAGAMADSGPILTVSDINAAMLEQGKLRAAELGPAAARCDWVEASAEDLPFPDASFDAYTISFGIRNVTNIDKALEEAHRVLVPGGRFMCLEFSHVVNPLVRAVYDKYSFEVIPVMGEVIAGDMDSYQYLVESIREFPNQEKFAQMIRDAGFKHVTHRDLTGGVAAIRSGFKF
eukprot:m.166454 g.166454  ORF g.166454 m.166454 type:complete len:327 (+) comp12691_c0_seq1:218-1198(+)